MLLKLQSAMEYLMTYGWAILIIAVVLAALFQLGVFNPNTFAPRAHAGACQVIRPYGIGNTNYISLAGTCNNQLPQYVASFDGANSIISGTMPVYSGSATLNVWILESSAPTNYNQFYVLWGNLGSARGFGIRDNYPSSSFRCEGEIANSAYAAFFATCRQENPNTWYMITSRYDSASSSISTYVNGVISSNIAVSGTINSFLGTFNIHVSNAGKQMMSNFQAYNTSLSQNDISALYQEGIGGAPIDLFHLVGWWPLNGNAKDYSGNLNNGIPSNVVYTSSWLNGYFAP